MLHVDPRARTPAARSRSSDAAPWRRRDVLLAIAVNFVFAVFVGTSMPADARDDSVDAQALSPALERVHPAWRDFDARWHSEACPFAPRMKFDKARIDCGYVLVPENRRREDSRLIKLSVARVRADSDAPAAGTSVYLTGGPGGWATLIAPSVVSSSSRRARNMRATSHWVFPDHRGTAFSEPDFCRGLHAELADPEPFGNQSRQRYADDVRRCLDEARTRGVDVAAYTTWDNAMDIRDIRRALGLAQWNLFGISYGTELGQMVLRVDEAGVRAAVLDSVVPPPPTSWEDFSFGMRSALDALDQGCRLHGACAERFGDLHALARATVDRYRQQPLAVPGIDRDLAPSGSVLINHHLAAYGIFQALYASDLYPALPAMLDAWARRDPTVMRAYIEQLARPAGPDWGHGLQAVANCTGNTVGGADDASMGGDDFWAEALVDGRITEHCSELGLYAPDPLNTLVHTAVPVLVLAGAVDPVTPPAFARALLPGLARGHYVEVPHGGHGATRIDCAADIMADFLRAPDAKPDVGCIASVDVPDFVTDYRATAGPLRLASHVREARYVAAAWGAVPALLLVFAVLAFPLAALGRRVDGSGAALPRARGLAWLASVFAVAGLALLAMSVQRTLSISPALLPLGLVGPTGAAGLLLLLALLAGGASLWMLRVTTRPLGTTLGVSLTGLAVLLLLAYCVQHDLVL
jgi:pimeloyl-ACP methyl ester carboxylesterase